MFYEMHDSDNYIQTCQQFLRGCINKKYTAPEQITKLNTNTERLLNDAATIAVCGFSPFGKRIASMFGKKTVIVDDYEVSGLSGGNETIKWNEFHPDNDIVCVISSWAHCGEYSNRLKDCNNKLNYNKLWLYSPQFDIPNLQFTGSEYVRAKLKDVYENAAVYLKMLSELGDITSKGLLAKVLLYRITLEDTLSIDTKSDGPEYFEPYFVTHDPEEIFVDAGGYNGDTLKSFLNIYGNKFRRYHFFEPVPNLFQKARSISSDSRIVFHNICLSNENREIFFDTEDGEKSGHIGSGRLCVRADTLDNCIDETVTFIKMDIEGAEMAALSGALDTIKRYRPKLAISVYHCPNDIANIYSFIKSCGDYQFYLRTTVDNLDYEIVLYAIPTGNKKSENFLYEKE